MKLSNINKPTSAKWGKIGASLVSVSAFIAGYGLTMNNQIVGFTGLAIGVIGTIITQLVD